MIIKNIMKLKDVKTLNDIKQGDTIIITGDILTNEPFKVQTVKVTEQDGTEIIFDKKMNRFFNLEMYLNGKSWVKECVT
jgi:Icc-related predicted phosphoesterase